MGEVYLAEQQAPIRRKVALKVIKAGMGSKQVIARFEAERQALALMDHPAIAKVFEAGETPDQRPYFVMEYVPGVPISEHCDRQTLTTRERLELFLQVCEGVQHAHQKAVIHRDLKPSNVLVSVQDGRATARIIDFGVAKAVSQRLTERTLFTELGVMIGTPEYMSPEQAELTGQDVDTRSDVYSLGVMLYELLVGALPFESKELRGAGYDEIRRRIREEDPPRPSAKLSSLGERSTESARHRKAEPKVLLRELRGDLDWITMHALEKDRTRRYGSPAELAADIGRHLRNEPVLAGPPRALYRAGKFVRRHRVGVVAAALVVVGLLGFAVTMAMETRRIGLERNRANREADTANRALEFLTELFKVSDPSQAQGNTLTAREALDRGAKKLDTELASEPVIQAKLMTTIGEVYLNLGLYEPAAPLLDRSLSLRRKLLGNDNLDTLASLNDAGALRRSQGKLKEAEPYYREALEGRRRVLGNDHPDTLASIANLGILLQNQGRFQEAEPYYREALEGRRRVLGNDHPDTLASINNMGVLLQSEGKLKDAVPFQREAMEGRRRVLGNDHPSTLMSMYNMGILLAQQGKFEESEPFMREALAGIRRVLGNDHPNTFLAMASLGILLEEQGKYGEAEPYYREALEGRRRALGNDHLDTLASINNMGTFFEAQGRLQEAEPYYREALEGRRRVLGNDHPHTLESIYNMGLLLHKQGKLKEAEPYYREALAGFRRVGNDHPNTLGCLNSIGLLLQQEGQTKEAESYYRQALEGRRRTLGDDHPDTLESMVGLGDLLTTQGRLEEAETLLKSAVVGARKHADEPKATGVALDSYGRCLTLMHRYADAEAALVEGEMLLVAADPDQDRKARKNLASLYQSWGKSDKAATWRAKASTP